MGHQDDPYDAPPTPMNDVAGNMRTQGRNITLDDENDAKGTETEAYFSVRKHCTTAAFLTGAFVGACFGGLLLYRALPPAAAAAGRGAGPGSLHAPLSKPAGGSSHSPRMTSIAEMFVDEMGNVQDLSMPSDTPDHASKYIKRFFADEMTKYGEYSWDALPSNIRDAAMVLGYDRTMWDGGGIPDISWSYLTEEEKEAATMIGWDEYAWDHQYSDLDWDDLPNNAKLAAAAFGLTEFSWSREEWPDWSVIDWDDLPRNKQLSLMALGHTKVLWQQNVMSTPTRLQDAKENDDERERTPRSRGQWDDISGEKKRSLVALGCTRKNWEDGRCRWSEIEWDGLDDATRRALMALGVTKEMWYDDRRWARLDEVLRYVGYHDGRRWIEEEWWNELGGVKKRALVVIGCTEDTWNSGKCEWPAWSKVGWNDIPKDKRRWLVALGYTQELWDDEGFDVLSRRDIPKNIRDAKEDVEEREWTPWSGGQWDDIPDDKKRSLMAIDCTREHWEDGGCRWPEAEWDDLNEGTRRALMALGINKEIWYDDRRWARLDEVMRDVGYHGGRRWIEEEWKDLADDKKRALVAIGCTGNSWENGWCVWPAWSEVGWGDIPEDKQRWLVALGYTQELWDDEGFDVLSRRDIPKNIRDVKKDIDERELTPRSRDKWDDIPGEKKRSLVALGCTREHWEDGGCRWPEVEWDDLNDDLRRTLVALGITKGMWYDNRRWVRLDEALRDVGYHGGGGVEEEWWDDVSDDKKS